MNIENTIKIKNKEIDIEKALKEARFQRVKNKTSFISQLTSVQEHLTNKYGIETRVIIRPYSSEQNNNENFDKQINDAKRSLYKTLEYYPSCNLVDTNMRNETKVTDISYILREGIHSACFNRIINKSYLIIQDKKNIDKIRIEFMNFRLLKKMASV